MVMRNIIYVVAFILFGIWIIGFFIYDIGDFIHLSLLAAIVLVIVRLIKGKKTFFCLRTQASQASIRHKPHTQQT